MMREQVARVALDWVGVPYRDGGHQRTGTDCVGLAIGIGKECGLVPLDFDPGTYAARPDGTMLDRMAEHMDRIPLRQIKAGSVVVMSYRGIPWHVGVMVTDKLFVHAFSPLNRVRLDTIDHNWTQPTRKLQAAFDLRGVF